ncbi:Rid family detoxifying hydrolase [Ornithinimicrobium faecis]|uniref:Rid family detoxifying hydrolase n=1 Tax=Ornithinimicrobium faecis TaxID=2934158 RepID=A0ABY4YY56_9MICO|nr:Rid family detoxifying hydrolase [Ornithinimicrobium sp. HY1793]USQ81685.1 Rid family detoxifying hydrolase [Ornithinimicrobium sp. HY1793]
MGRTAISAPEAPQPIGPYSPAVRDKGAGLLFVSGQTPIDPATGELVDGDVGTQTQRVFANLKHVLGAAGCTLADVIKVNVYLISMADFAAVNEVYATVFEAPYPARTTVAVAELPLGARVEIELVAR